MRAEILQRLRTGRWKPGELLPTEADLAAELGCARGTVNRALQAVADEGLLERRRRGGTRVVLHPDRKATLRIPIIRREIERQGHAYGYALLTRRTRSPAASVRERMASAADASFLEVRALHTADGRPRVLEERWIDTSVVPTASDADFRRISANEWLVSNVPYGGGELAMSAAPASVEAARRLACAEGEALFVIDRRTHDVGGTTITLARLTFAPGYRMRIEL